MTTIIVSSGGSNEPEDPPISSGVIVEVLSGGQILDTTILSGGLATLSSGAIGESLVVSSGGRLTGDGEVDGVYVFDSGQVSGVTLFGYSGPLYVYSGGSAVAVKDSGGEIAIIAGGTATGAVLEGLDATEAVSGVASGTIVRSGGEEDVFSGGVAVGDVVSSGGNDYISAGGVLSGAVVSVGGSLTIEPDASYSGVTVQSGGGVFLSPIVRSGQNLSVGAVSSTTTFSGATISSGGVLGVGDATVDSGGVITLLPGAVMSDEVTVEAGGLLSGSGEVAGSAYIAGEAVGMSLGEASGDGYGYMEVESGGSASAVTVFGGEERAQLVVDSGATTFGAVMTGAAPGLNGFEEIYGVASGTIVEQGGEEVVSSGGSAVGGVVSAGGTLFIYGGGSASGETVRGGAAASDLVVSSGQNVVAGFLTSAETVSGVTVSSGGLLTPFDDAVVLGGGTLTLSSGTGGNSYFAVSSGGLAIISSGADADYVSVASDGTLSVVSGGEAGFVTVSTGGLVTLSSGAEVFGTLVEAGGKLAGPGQLTEQNYDQGLVSGVTVGAVGFGADVLVVEAGGSASAITVIASGVEVISSGCEADATTVSSGGRDDVEAGGLASGTTVSSDGVEYVFGVASGALVSNAGQEIVRSGGVTDGATMLSGGVAYISSGSTASGDIVSAGGAEVIVSGGLGNAATLSAGKQDVDAGGLASGTVISSGGVAYVYGAASGTVVSSGGQEIVLSGAVASGTTVTNGGLEYVYSGGTTSGLVLAAGGEVIDDGKVRNTGDGTLAGTLRGSGYLVETTSGDLLVSGAGAAYTGEAVIEGGTLELGVAGAIGTGSVDFVAPTPGSAVLQIDAADAPAAGGTFANVISNFNSAGEDIDLRSIAFVSGASATVVGSTLVLTDGGHTYTFDIAGTTAGAYPVLSDGHGGTLIDPTTASTPKAIDPKVLAFAHATAAFAPSDATTVMVSSTSSLTGQTPFAHATASAGAGRL